MKILFATHNKHKIEEIKQALNNQFYELISLDDLEFHQEIPEPYPSLEENARAKSEFASSQFNLNCFADDTGLEIDALNGEPGVFSARWAGPHCSYSDNVAKALREMKGQTNRKAQFRTIISLIYKGKEHQFEGKVKGCILTEPRGEMGFGYDPIFQPEGYNQSFAEMPLELKNKISHRGLAVAKLVEFLNKQA